MVVLWEWEVGVGVGRGRRVSVVNVSLLLNSDCPWLS